MISAKALKYALATMGMIRYFPSDVEVKAKVGELIGKMCANDEQACWLADRMVQLHGREWPGPDELRATFCSKFRPKDGIEKDSEVYHEGIPSENPNRNAQLEAGAALKKITGDTIPANDAADVLADLVRKVKAKSEAIKPRPMIADKVEEGKAVYRFTCDCGEKGKVAVLVTVLKFSCPAGCGAVYEHWQGLSGAYRAVCVLPVEAK